MSLKRVASSPKFLFWLLFLTAVVLKFFYAVRIAPHALNQDEAAILLNAKYIAQAGKDEWGATLPIVFRSFGDAKLPGMIYIVSFLGRVFGFSTLAVRLPAFLAGVAISFIGGLLATKLTGRDDVGLSTRLFLLISPWTYHYSSVGFEAHVGLALFLFALFIWERRGWWADALGALIYLAACLTYNAPLLLFPLVLIWFVLRRWSNKRRAVGDVFFAALAFGVALALTLSATAQKQGIAFFTDANVVTAYPMYRAQFPGLLATLLGNRWVYWLGIAVQHFVASWSPQFLVLQGGNNPWHTIPLTGHIVWVVYLSAALGIGILLQQLYFSFRNRDGLSFRRSLLLFLLLIGSLAPAVITTDAPHATRSLFFFYIATVVAGLGFSRLYADVCPGLTGRKYQRYIEGFIALFVIASFAWWWVPAAQHWREAINIRWYAGFETVLDDPRVQHAQRIAVVDPEGVLYTRVALHDHISASDFLGSIKRSPPQTTGIVRGERLGKYRFIFHKADALPGEVLLEQTSNQQWDIIEL